MSCDYAAKPLYQHDLHHYNNFSNPFILTHYALLMEACGEMVFPSIFSLFAFHIFCYSNVILFLYRVCEMKYDHDKDNVGYGR